MKTAKDLNNDVVIKLWLDTTLTNQAILKKLGTEWKHLQTKITVNKTVKAAIEDVERSSGIKGDVISVKGKSFTREEKASASKAAPTKAAPKKKTSSKVSADVEEEVDTTNVEQSKPSKKFSVTIKIVRNNSTVDERSYSGASLTDAFSKFKTVAIELGINKVDFYRNGNIIDSAEIRNGDTVEARQRLTAACPSIS